MSSTSAAGPGKVTVVCAGATVILDLRLNLGYLETGGPPVPRREALDGAEIEAVMAEAVAQADANNVAGPAITPHAAEMTTVGVSFGVGSPQKPIAAGATKVVDSSPELTHVIG